MDSSNIFGDPTTMALLGLSQGLLAAGSPQRFPTSVGGALSQGIGGALSGAMNAQHYKLAAAQAKVAQQNADLMDALNNIKNPTIPAATPNAAAAGGDTPAGFSPNTSQLIFGTPNFASQAPTPVAAKPLDWRQQKAAEFRATADQYQTILAQKPGLVATPAGAAMQKSVQEFYGLANQLDPTPTFGRPTTVMVNGKPTVIQPNSRGGMQPIEGASPLPNIKAVDQGNQTQFVDMNSVQPGSSLPKGISPSTILTINNQRAMQNARLLAQDPLAIAGGQPPVGSLPPLGQPSAPGAAPVVTQTQTPAPGTAKTGYFGITPDMHGEDVLSKLPQEVGSQVKALAEGRMQFPGGFALKSPYWQRMIQLVSQYDPSFDAVNYNARAQTRQDFVKGKSADNITALNTAIYHLGSLEKNMSALNNTRIPAYNYVANAVGEQVGNQSIQTAKKATEADAEAVSHELAKVFRSTGMSEGEVAAWREKISTSSSPAQRKAIIGEALHLMEGRLEALGERYSRGMGTTKEPLSLLDPKARAVYQQLKETTGEALPQGSSGGIKFLGFEK